MYSSCWWMRAASVSAMAYMRTTKSTAAATNHATPVARMWKSAPRSAAAAMTTTTCSVHRPRTTSRLPSTSSGRGMGAASSSRCAPLSRSTSTLSPAKTVASGTSRPTVPMATKAV